jgi:hypothetical protein
MPMDITELRMRCVEAAIKVASAQALRCTQNVVDIATAFEQYVIGVGAPTATGETISPDPSPQAVPRRGPGRPRKSEADNLLS